MSKVIADTKQAGEGVDWISLAEMHIGDAGTIVQIAGGYGLSRKLDAMGIREGQEITKVSGQWMRGPVLLRRNNTRVALGFGMARKVFLRLAKKADPK